MRHKFELTLLEVSAKNKQLFFFKSLREQNITSPLTGVKEPIGSLGSFFDFLPMSVMVARMMKGEENRGGIAARAVVFSKPSRVPDT